MTYYTSGQLPWGVFVRLFMLLGIWLVKRNNDIDNCALRLKLKRNYDIVK